MIPGYLKINGPLHRLARDGGVEIFTPEIIGDPKENHILFKSLIQPDGDIITHIYDENPDGELWQQHCRKLERFSGELDAFRRFVQKLSYAGPVVGCGIAGMLGWGEFNGWLKNQLYWLILGTAASVHAFFLKKILVWGVKRWVMKKNVHRVQENNQQE